MKGLAALGAQELPPAARSVPFARTEIVPEARRAAVSVLASGWVTSGPETAAFEADLAARLGAAHVVAVASCTQAIELSLRALHLPPSSPVLTPSLTFCGAVQAILAAGLRPYLVDIDPHTLVPSVRSTADAARRADAPAAMVVQHHAGYPVPVADLAAAAGIQRVHVVEDAAHGLGASLPGEAVGSRSHAACLSFYATKNLPIGEGGAVCTDDEELAARIRSTRLHGMSRDAWRRYLPGGSWVYDVSEPGMKANFTDLQAAIGRAQLAHLTNWQQRRAQLADRYLARLADVPGLRLPALPPDGTHAWHLFQVRIGSAFGISRDAVVTGLSEAGVGTSVHFIPVHRLTHFRRELTAEERGELPATDSAFAELLSLPMHPGLTDSDVDYVCDRLLGLRERPRNVLETKVPTDTWGAGS